MEFSIESEVVANRIAQRTNIATCIVLVLLAAFNTVGFFELPRFQTLVMFACIQLVVLPVLLYGHFTHARGTGLRYLETFICLLQATMLVALAGHVHSLVFLTPLVLAIAYLDRRFLFVTYGLLVLGMFAAAFGNAHFGVPDVNLIPFGDGQIVAWRDDIENACQEIGFDRGAYFLNVLRYCTAPNVVLTGIIVVLADGVMRVSRRRAEAAEAFSRGLLDTIGMSPRKAKEKVG